MTDTCKPSTAFAWPKSHMLFTGLPKAGSRRRIAVRSFFRDRFLRLTTRHSTDKLQLLNGSARTAISQIHNYEPIKVDSDYQLGGAGPKVVAIRSFGHTTSVLCILEQVRGGRIEKMICHRGRNSWLEIRFLSAASASHFANYATHTGFVVVNGIRPQVTLLLEFSMEKPQLQRSSNSGLMQLVISENASRVLHLSKVIPSKASHLVSGNCTYPNPELNFSGDFDAETLKWDLVMFGGIVEIMPLVSRKLAVAVQFSDIRSAMMAVLAMHDTSSAFFKKYSDWEVKYGRDPGDRPMYAI